MQKKIMATTIALSLATSVTFASPLNDFSKGKVSIDLSSRYNKVKYGNSGLTADYDIRGFGYGVTCKF